MFVTCTCINDIYIYIYIISMYVCVYIYIYTYEYVWPGDPRARPHASGGRRKTQTHAASHSV